MITELATLPTRSELDAAHGQCRAMLTAEQGIRDNIKALCERTWEFGRTLAVMKEMVGHGKWMLFVSAHFPELGGNDKTRSTKAAKAIAFYAENPNSAVPLNFTTESVRKCIFHMAPEKERPQLPGDRSISPTPHQLTFVNHFSKWWQQIESGLVPKPPVDVFRRDMEATVKQIAEYGGADWIQSLL